MSADIGFFQRERPKTENDSINEELYHQDIHDLVGKVEKDLNSLLRIADVLTKNTISSDLSPESLNDLLKDLNEREKPLSEKIKQNGIPKSEKDKFTEELNNIKIQKARCRMLLAVPQVHQLYNDVAINQVMPGGSATNKG